jgi:hypothetical protein
MLAFFCCNIFALSVPNTTFGVRPSTPVKLSIFNATDSTISVDYIQWDESYKTLTIDHNKTGKVVAGFCKYEAGYYTDISVWNKKYGVTKKCDIRILCLDPHASAWKWLHNIKTFSPDNMKWGWKDDTYVLSFEIDPAPANQNL